MLIIYAVFYHVYIFLFVFISFLFFSSKLNNMNMRNVALAIQL